MGGSEHREWCSHASTYPRGVIPRDLHPLEVGHGLVQGGGGDDLVDGGQFGCRFLSHRECQRNCLQAEQALLPAGEENLRQTAPAPRAGVGSGALTTT